MFPDDFLLGAATAAYQVEGAVTEDGREPSIWDTFSHTPGAVRDGHTGDVACDHYHRYLEDVELMASIGLRAYRFSVAWPRLADLSFYDRLVDALLAKGIAPVVTLYHWDLPQRLQDRGGWTARETSELFAEYATAVYRRLGDRVHTWTTLNEPWVSAFVGYGSGRHAPGIADPAAAFTAAHNLLRAHGLAVAALRAAGARSVSITLNLTPIHGDPEPATLVDGLANRLFLDPVLKGRYPQDVLRHMSRFVDPAPFEADLPVIAQPIDVLGVNYYTTTEVAAEQGAPGHPEYPGTEGIRFLPPRGPVTEMGWGVVPSGLTELLLRLARDYPGTPLMITENGAAYDDKPDASGAYVDTDRVDFLAAHLRAARDAMDRGVDLRGYFVWSLLDNFEWAHGYHKRFGLVHVDYATQRRTPKLSASWYRDFIATGRLRPNDGTYRE
ncbi:GH1 family beta-glucosidase [Thermostaphylospora chromogena]|uniref:Beta-glucosidase n=1 Tax=Thermostaphylospora chromogena TaxID=35622 RepID=A0A1H1I2G0_9ACTN|nr:GH1 family beta-glucosidase [Thermostaphylospora chromogena]SDR31887.1 beta-glucosidase [Thermostaphylospora chromogena]